MMRSAEFTRARCATIQYKFWNTSESYYIHFFFLCFCRLPVDSMFQWEPFSTWFPEWADTQTMGSIHTGETYFWGDTTSVVLCSCSALSFEVISFLTAMKVTIKCWLYFILFSHCYYPWTSILTPIYIYHSTQVKKNAFMANIFPVIQLSYPWKSYCECLFCFCMSFIYQKLL